MESLTFVQQRSRKRASALIGLTLAASFALVGCSPDESTPSESSASPTPSATPTPTAEPTAEPITSAAPATEDEAIDAATDAVNGYFDQLNAINLAGGPDVQTIETFAMDPLLATTIEAKKAEDEAKLTYTGGVEITVRDAKASTRVINNESIPFGSAGVIACFDDNNRAAELDGVPFERQGSKAFVIDATVNYDPESESWKTAALTVVEEAC